MITVATAKSKKWKPIKRTGRTDDGRKANDSMTDVVDLTSTSNRTTFAKSTNFKERDKTLASTPGKAGNTTKEDELKEVVAQVRIKILPGAEDIQETVLALMNHCLTVLKEQDKTACFVNSTKSLIANKLTDFPKDFTDFYDNWGVWEEPLKSFLNTMPAGRGRSLSGSFYFRSTWDPDKLFEKVLLRMAAVAKIKGTITINMKIWNEG